MLKILKKEHDDWFLKNFKELSDKLVYLHAALCEALRLYPSVIFNIKTPVQSDILPSGHQVNQNTQIIFNMYSMGRMKLIWGDDCSEFNPERWISKRGTINHEPSHKFSVFGSGPRACIGKQMAFAQMKIVAVVIIRDYYIEALEKQHKPFISLISHIKDGLKVKVFRAEGS
ncbi:unnamed protein product [Amaranthus hypochondriacus]